MKTAPLFALTMFLGVVLTVHLAMNGEVGKVMNNPRVANAIFWCIGAVMAIGIGITGYKTGALAPMSEVPVWLWIAGAIGATLVFAIAAIAPNMGAASFFITLLAGQIVGALVLSHFGWLGNAVEPITMWKLVGAALMFAGAYIVTFVK